MVKPEWGTKRTCPKCGTRFYDLGTDDPVQCIECGNAWQPEPVLKSKQPLPFEEAPKKVADNVEADADWVGDDDLDIDIDDDGDSPRAEEHRVGKECSSTGRSRGSQSH